MHTHVLKLCFYIIFDGAINNMYNLIAINEYVRKTGHSRAFN